MELCRNPWYSGLVDGVLDFQLNLKFILLLFFSHTCQFSQTRLSGVSWIWNDSLRLWNKCQFCFFSLGQSNSSGFFKFMLCSSLHFGASFTQLL